MKKTKFNKENKYSINRIILEKTNKNNKVLAKKILSELTLDVGAGGEDAEKADPLWLDLAQTPIKSIVDFLRGKISKVKNLIRNKFEELSDNYFLQIVNSGNSNVQKPDMYQELLDYINMEDPSKGTEIKAIKSKSMENVLDMQFRRMRAEFTGNPWKQNIEKYLELIKSLALELYLYFENLLNKDVGYDIALNPIEKNLVINKNIKDLISTKKKILIQLKVNV